MTSILILILAEFRIKELSNERLMRDALDQISQIQVNFIGAAVHAALMNVEAITDELPIAFTFIRLPYLPESGTLDVSEPEAFIEQVGGAGIDFTRGHDVSPKIGSGLAFVIADGLGL